MKQQPKEWRFEDIKEGYETESIPLCFSEDDIDTFARLSGDYNPLHNDVVFAKNKGYKGRVVHGMLLSSAFSYLVGMVIPGKDCIYVSQDVRFHKPVLAGQDLSLKGTIVGKSESTQLVEIKTEIFNDLGERVVSGIAKVKII